MVTEFIAECIGAIFLNEDVRWDAVNLEIVADISPLRIIQSVVKALDVRNHLKISADWRSLIGNVYPYEIVTCELSCLIRFIGSDGRTTWTAPGVPEIHKHYFSFIRGNDSLEKFLHRF